MRPAAIPDEAIWAGAHRMVIAPPDGDLTSTDIAPVEVLIDHSEMAGVPRISARCVLEDGDLDKLVAGGTVWVSFYGGQLMPFSVEVVGPEGD